MQILFSWLAFAIACGALWFAGDRNRRLANGNQGRKDKLK